MSDGREQQAAGKAAVEEAGAALEKEGIAAPDTWLAAIRGLRDNPLAHYLQLMLRRQARRQVNRTSIILRSALVLATLIGAYFLTWPSLVQSGMAPAEMRIVMAVLIVLPAFIIFYFRGLFIAFQACLSALNRWQVRRQPGLIDELARGTQLTDREIVVGMARLILPLLVRRVLVAAVLLQLVLLFVAYELSGIAEFSRANAQAQFGDEYAARLTACQTLWEQSRRAELVSAPVALAAVIATGLLAAVLSFLWLLALGRRGASPAAIASEAAFLTVMQMLGSIYAMLTHMSALLEGVVDKNYFALIDTVAAGAAGLALFLTLLLGLGWLAWRWLWVRAVAVSILPLVAVALAVCTQTGRAFGVGLFTSGESVFSAFQVWFSSLCLTNALAVPVYNALGLDQTGSIGPDVGGVYWCADVLPLLLLQIMLLPVLAWLARDSVRRFRAGR